MKTLHIVIIAIALYTIVFHLVAGASEKEHDHQTINNIYKDDNSDNWKYAVGGAILIGAIVCTYISIKNKKACWEPDKKEPLPNPGPVLKMTPDVPTGVRLYQ